MPDWRPAINLSRRSDLSNLIRSTSTIAGCYTPAMVYLSGCAGRLVRGRDRELLKLHSAGSEDDILLLHG